MHCNTPLSWILKPAVMTLGLRPEHAYPQSTIHVISVNATAPCSGNLPRSCLKRCEMWKKPKQGSGLLFVMLFVVLWVTFSSVLHGRLRKAGEMVAVGVSTVKKKEKKTEQTPQKTGQKIYMKKRRSNKVEAVVCGCVLRWCSGTLSCGKHKQM